MEPLRRSSDLFSLEWNFGSIGILDGNDIDRKMGTHSDEEIILASSRPKKRAGRKKFKETRHPVYRGVRRRNTNKWVCEVREPSKQSRIWLGTYPTADMAARAHDVAALAFKGQTTTLNFADSVWRLPVPVSKDPKDIRKAAMEAAEEFRPRSGIEISPICIEDLKREKVGDGRSSNNEERESVFYMDEEEVVSDMKDWAVNMAEGPLFSPSTSRSGCGFSWDDIDSDVEVSLWSNWSY